MRPLRVALLQMESCGTDQDANLSKGEAFCRRAQLAGADIALFPEMWNVGYAECPSDPRGRAEWESNAVNADGPFVKHFMALAAELEIAIAVSFLEKWRPTPRNSVSLIDRRGAVVLTYAKVHTCDFAMESSCTPGDDFYVSSLDTAAGEVKVGAMICYDREFPESARVLMLKGAEIILTPNACPLDDNRLGVFRARAVENMVGAAMTNYAAPQENGHSIAFNAVAYDENGNAVDPLIIEAGPAEGVYLAQFDLDSVRAYRRRETWGNAFRKPSRYGALTSPEVDAPFVRREARR